MAIRRMSPPVSWGGWTMFYPTQDSLALPYPAPSPSSGSPSGPTRVRERINSGAPSCARSPRFCVG